MGRSGRIYGLVVLGSCSSNPGESRAVAIDAHLSSTCVVSSAGRVRCWGHNFNNEGILGYGDTNNVGDDEHPAEAGDVSLRGPVKNVFVGPRSMCAVMEGEAQCWGARLGEPSGNLGDELPSEGIPTDWFTLGHPKSIGVGLSLACGLLADGRVECKDLGQVALSGAAIQLSVGARHACAVLADESIQCWGTDLGGGLGYPGVTEVSLDEVSELGAVDVGGAAAQVLAMDAATCALLRSGAVRCWGHNLAGTLGAGDSPGFEACKASDSHGPDCRRDPRCCIGDDEVPAQRPAVPLGGGEVSKIRGRYYHACAVFTDGRLRCWGDNGVGQLGDGTTRTTGDDEPAGHGNGSTLDGSVVDVAPGRLHTCALLEGGDVRCWGYAGDRGYLGLGRAPLGCFDAAGLPACTREECCVGDDEAITSVPRVRVF